MYQRWQCVSVMSCGYVGCLRCPCRKKQATEASAAPAPAVAAATNGKMPYPKVAENISQLIGE